MKKQFLLASASILAAMVATAAYAGDSNSAAVNQTGSQETATINQSGSNNLVGPAATQPIYQTGVGDALSVTQSGANNVFDGNDAKTPGSVVQSGASNAADVTQSGTASTVHLSQSGTGNGVFNQWEFRGLFADRSSRRDQPERQQQRRHSDPERREQHVRPRPGRRRKCDQGYAAGPWQRSECEPGPATPAA